MKSPKDLSLIIALENPGVCNKEEDPLCLYSKSNYNIVTNSVSALQRENRQDSSALKVRFLNVHNSEGSFSSHYEFSSPNFCLSVNPKDFWANPAMLEPPVLSAIWI